MTNTRNDERVAAYLDDCGKDRLTGYGAWWLLLEIVAEQMSPTDEKCTVTYSRTQWSRMLYLHHNQVGRYMGNMGGNGLVTVESIGDKISVSIPNLLKYRDEYSKKSGRTPDKVRTMSPLEQNRTEQNGKTPELPFGPSVENPAKKMIWDIGVQLFIQHGDKENNARSYLGKLAKQHGESKLAEAIAYLSTHPAIEPKAYLSKMLTKTADNPIVEYYGKFI